MTGRDLLIAAPQKEDPARRRAGLDEACAQEPGSCGFHVTFSDLSMTCYEPTGALP
jgi:hypothetical protein